MAIDVVKVLKTGKEFDDAVKFLSALDVIAVDTETQGIDPLVDKVLLLSAGNMYKQYVFDIAKLETSLDPILAVLNNPTPVKILHNAKFDYKFLKHNLNIVLENMYDTMLAEMLLLKGRKVQGFGLDDVCSKYLNIPMNKDIRKSFVEHVWGKDFSEEQLYYSGVDVAYLHDIRIKQQAFLKQHRLENVAKLEMMVIPATGDLELNGMHLDPVQWKDAEVTATAAREEAKKALDIFFAPVVGVDMFGCACINYNSPKQLLPSLKTIVGAAAANLKSTGEDAIRGIDHPAIDALLLYREKEKLVSTYGGSFLENLHPVTKRIHSEFSQLFTDTGRFSSKNVNLQNLPKEKVYRKAFTAKNTDYRIVGADYSGMELRILADLSEESSWLDCFERGGDLHSENGSTLMGKTMRRKGTNGPDDPGENEELRGPVKTLNFGVGGRI